MSGGVIKPHGGRLVNRLATRRGVLRGPDEFKGLPELSVDTDKMRDIENIASGVFSPLEGFNGEEELLSILKDGRLPNWIPWTIPILLDVDEKFARAASDGGEILITESTGEGQAIMRVEESYSVNKKNVAQRIFQTVEVSHPGVARTYAMKNTLLSGKIDLIREGTSIKNAYDLKPSDTRAVFEKRRWDTVVGFQTRNVPHLGHEYLQKTAMNFTDGLFINPVIGKKKKGDFRDEVILGSYEVLVNFYFPRERVLLGALRTEMRYAGPKEAIFHAIIRKNYGCTHFVVGRDHAGVGQYYDPYAAQMIFSDFNDLGISPMFFTSFFYCKKCASVCTDKTCPHGEEHRSEFSGTLLRQQLNDSASSPLDLVRPEVLEVIRSWEDPFV